MKLPSPVTPGQPLSAKAFNELLAYVRSLDLRGGPGIRVQRSMVGTTVSAAEHPRPSAKLSLVHPFQVSNASTETAAIVRVRSGSVNDVVATGIAPTDQSLAAAGTWRIYLDCTLSDDAEGTVTAVAVAVVNGDQPDNTRTHAYITLATATVVAGETEGFVVSEVAQLVTHSLRFYACGRTEPTEEVPTPEDGSYNFWGV